MLTLFVIGEISLSKIHFRANFLEGKVLRKPHKLQQHTVVIAIHQNNIDKLRGILEDISDMRSPNYGKHLTREEVASITADPLKTKAVIEHFTGKGAELVEQTANGEYITMRAPVGLWEETFSAAFEEVELASGERLLRSHTYSIPEELSVHIASVDHILQVISIENIYNTKQPFKYYFFDFAGSKAS